MAKRTTKSAAANDAATGDADAAANVNTDNAQSSGAATTDEPKPARQKPPKPKPNVKLAGQAEPLGAGKLTVGMDVIGELPDAATQKAGWHCDFAGRLVQLYPDRFKLIVEKGN